MTVATLRLDLRLRHCSTHRETRRQTRAIMDKLRKHFNVSIDQAEPGDDPSLVILVAAAVAATRRDALETLERVADAVAAHPRVEVLRQDVSER